MTVYFIIAVGLSIYLIYLIKDSKLQTTVLAIASTIFGGLLTIAGVAWTIKHSQTIKRKEKIEKSVPQFSYAEIEKKTSRQNYSQTISFTRNLNNYQYQNKLSFELENSNKNSFVIEKIFHDDCWVEADRNSTILPSAKYLITLNFAKINNIFLEIRDESNIIHYYEMYIYQPNRDMNKFYYTIKKLKK